MTEQQLQTWIPIIISGIVSIITGIWALINQLRIEKIKFEHQIQFTELHKERLIFIKELYKKIASIQGLLLPFVANDTFFDAISTKFDMALNELKPYFYQNSLLLSEELSDKINNLFTHYELLKTRRQNLVERMKSEIGDAERKDNTNKIYDMIVKDNYKIMDDLNREFRTILGVK